LKTKRVALTEEALRSGSWEMRRVALTGEALDLRGQRTQETFRAFAK
jgi:hypothetical protein